MGATMPPTVCTTVAACAGERGAEMFEPLRLIVTSNGWAGAGAGDCKEGAGARRGAAGSCCNSIRMR